MQRLEGEVFTYARIDRRDLTLREGATEESFGFDRIVKTARYYEGPTWATVPAIRAASPFPVSSYRQLVQIVAHLASGNRLHTLLFRGQKSDYKDSNGRSVLYPTLFRPEPGQKLVRATRIRRRVSELRFARRRVMQNRVGLELHVRLHNHPESPIALLQHYEICPTPYLDVTQSLRVASSIALMGAKEGFVFVLAFPHPHASISHFVDHETVLIKLLSVCPYRALRPAYDRSSRPAGERTPPRAAPPRPMDPGRSLSRDKNTRSREGSDSTGTHVEDARRRRLPDRGPPAGSPRRSS